MEQRQSFPLYNKVRYLKLVIRIILTVFLTFYLISAANAQRNAYFPASEPLRLPITITATEIPQWELFAVEQDQLYALDFKNGKLIVFDLQKHLQRQLNLPIPAEPSTTNCSIWVIKERIYLKPAADDLVWIINPQGILLRKLSLKNATDGYCDFGDMVVDPRGYIYLLDSRTSEIKIFNPEGGYEGVFLKKGERPNNLPDLPYKFSLDNEGNFYIMVYNAETSRSRILKYSYQGRFLTTFVDKPTPYFYQAIWVDPFQNIFTLAPEESLVVKFDSRGQKICQFQAGCLTGLASNRRGTVFVVSAKGNVINQFLPSRVVTLIDRGNRALADNRPDQAEACFKQALILDNQLDYIHSILGEVYFVQRRFSRAMAEFRYLRDQWRYSQSLDSFRKELMADYRIYYGGGLIIFIFLGCLLFFVIKKTPSQHLIGVLGPDTIRKIASILSPFVSIVLILILTTSYYFSWYFTNPIFTVERQVFSVQIYSRYLIIFLTLTLVWSGVAYKVGELFQGLATYRLILGGTITGISPMIVGFPLLALLSHLLTYDLLWVYQWFTYCLFFLAALLLLTALKVTEDFSWGKALGIGLINLTAFGLFLLFSGFLVGVNQQLAGFLHDLTSEIFTRLTI